jgi:hypothetical protein
MKDKGDRIKVLRSMVPRASHDEIDLLCKMLEIDPSKRITTHVRLNFIFIIV